MRIAVLSDTHNRLPEAVCTAITGADEIWHLGDVMQPRIIERLEQLGSPMRVVRGNCDQNEAWPLQQDFALEGLRIVLVHIPPRRAPPAAGLLFHGHTHVPRNELVGSTRFFNPGSVGKPNKGAPASYAWLELNADMPAKWSVELI